MQARLWTYLPNGVLSDDGAFEFSGMDRTSYLVRMGGVVAIVEAENFSDEAGGVAAFHLPEDQEVQTIDGPRQITASERQTAIEFIRAAAPLLDRRPVFQ